MPKINNGPISGCLIFLGKTYQNVKNIPIDHRMYQMAIRYIKWFHIFQTAIKYTNLFFSKTL
jgi:hypothetical protein